MSNDPRSPATLALRPNGRGNSQHSYETNLRRLDSFKIRQIRPFQENKSPKNGEFSEGKTSGLGGFNFWNYLCEFKF